MSHSGTLKAARIGLAHLDLILKRVRLGDVILVRRGHERAQRNDHIARADPFLGQGELGRGIFDGNHRVILVDDQRRHETVARVRQGDRNRCRQVEHAEGIECIHLHPDHRLGIDRDRVADVVEFPETAEFDIVAHGPVGFGALEIVDGNEFSSARRQNKYKAGDDRGAQCFNHGVMFLLAWDFFQLLGPAWLTAKEFGIYSTGSKSPGFQVLSNQGSSGP
jgi:hypothetical protein